MPWAQDHHPPQKTNTCSLKWSYGATGWGGEGGEGEGCEGEREREGMWVDQGGGGLVLLIENHPVVINQKNGFFGLFLW